MKLEGRAAIVTGGGRGVGRGIAMALAEAGADVAINYRRDEVAASETVAAIDRAGRRAFAFLADVRDSQRVEAMVARAIDTFGKVDILACSAGVASRGNYLADTDVEEMRRLLDIHLFGALHFARALLPRGDDEMHYAAGLGLALQSFQIDLAVDFADRVDTVSLSAIYSF